MNLLKTSSIIIFILSFGYCFLLSFHFPAMWADDIYSIKEAARGFSFPTDSLMTPRFVYIYIYKTTYYFFGFNIIAFRIVKCLLAALGLTIYYNITKKILNTTYANVALTAMLLSSPFIWTTIWLSEAVITALTTQLLTMYFILFTERKIISYLIISFMSIIAIFSRETNLIIIPILIYYFIIEKSFFKKTFSIIPILFFVLHRIIIPTREVFFAPNNAIYYITILFKYYTLLIPLVAGFILYSIWQNIKTRKLLQNNQTTFIIMWFLAGYTMLLFGHNQEERYIVEILPPFFLLSLLSYRSIHTKKWHYDQKKLFTTLNILVITIALATNGYGILKTELGWGDFFKGIDKTANYISKHYPGSAVTYQSGTGDFYSDYRNFTEIPRYGAELNMTHLYSIQPKYTKIIYVEYPKTIRAWNNKDIAKFNYIRSIQHGRYTFNIYELKNKTNN